MWQKSYISWLVRHRISIVGKTFEPRKQCCSSCFFFFFVSGEFQDVAVTLYNTTDQSAKNMSCWYKRFPLPSELSLILDLAPIKFCHETKGWSAHRGGADWSQWDTVEQTVNCLLLSWQNRTGVLLLFHPFYVHLRNENYIYNTMSLLEFFKKKSYCRQEEPYAVALLRPSPSARVYLPCQYSNVAIAAYQAAGWKDL